MVAATVLYNGTVKDTAAIITALGTNAATTIIVVPEANGQAVCIYKQGS